MKTTDKTLQDPLSRPEYFWGPKAEIAGTFYWDIKHTPAERRRLKKTIAKCTKAIRKSPGKAGLYNTRAACYLDLDLPVKALDDLNRALELDPGQPAFYANRGAAYAYMDNYEKSIADYDRSIAAAPRDPHGYIERAMASASRAINQAHTWAGGPYTWP